MLALIVLAILQGIAEFLPISSSGHLVLAKTVLRFSETGATAEIFLHFGTLLAILVFYREKLLQIVKPLLHLQLKDDYAKLFWLILWASMPAGIVGVLWQDAIEAFFSRPSLASAMLLLTSAMLFCTIFARRRTNFRWNLFTAAVVGLVQALAILPGISRSGSTIAVALLLGADAENAAEFSFILAIPALAGAMALKIREIVITGNSPKPELLVAVVVSALVGYIALSLLIPILRRGKLWIFGTYCALVGLLGFMLT